MLRLRMATGPERLDIERLGVTLTVRPHGTSVMEDARNDPALIEERDTLCEDLGVAAEDLPQHKMAELMHRAIARAAILAWDGVLGEDGEPIEAVPEAIDAAMAQDQFYRAFVDLYIVPGWQVEAEKNG